MNRKITLTGGRKMMNMAKLGTVIQSKTRLAKNGNPRKQRAGGLMRYTLCVLQGWAKRNGSRHSFAFDIAAISGRALFSVGKLAKKSGSYVIPGQVIPQYHKHTGQNRPQSLTGRGSRSKFTLKTTVPAFSGLGGCHE